MTHVKAELHCWQESMETKTELLSTQALEISPSTKVAEMHSLLASKLGWPAVDGLERYAIISLCISPFSVRLLLPMSSLNRLRFCMLMPQPI